MFQETDESNRDGHSTVFEKNVRQWFEGILRAISPSLRTTPRALILEKEVWRRTVQPKLDPAPPQGQEIHLPSLPLGDVSSLERELGRLCSKDTVGFRGIVHKNVATFAWKSTDTPAAMEVRIAREVSCGECRLRLTFTRLPDSAA